MYATIPFREALNKGIVSGTLVDTKVILFSRRDTSGKIYSPKALYASSHVLKSIPHFNDLLFGNFSEAELKDLNDDVGSHESTAEDYDYSSDSDLEDDEDEKPTPPTLTPNESNVGTSSLSHFPVDEEARYEDHNELANGGKIVMIPDIAFVTFQAFVFYLYTGRIEFAPLGSRQNRGSRVPELQTPPGDHDNIPRPSSKSIYRLADKYDAQELRDLALNHLRNELRNCDIVEETFSVFASRYDDIKMACIPLLVSALRNETAEKKTWTRLCEVIESHFKGELPHVTDTLSLLWETANRDHDATVATISNDTPSPTNINIPPSGDALQRAIVKSFREGVFFDLKCWARYSKKGSAFKAIYFSSIVVGCELKACITYFDGDIFSAKAPTEGMDSESDYSIEAKDSTEEGNRGARVVLSPGSHAAWRSLFFYKCTGHISFAPLRSQGVDSRSRYIFEKTATDAPPPCSPKSICTLASLFNLQQLHDLALEDIERKLSEGNIVEEFFSRVSASDDKILEVECRLLFSKFKSKNTLSLVQEKIGGVNGKHLAHHANAFKLGLRTALDQKKHTPQADVKEGVFLRCWNSGCPGNKEHIPFSLVGSRDACLRCNAWRLQCVCCGHIRQDCGTRCASCGKGFL